MSSLFFHGLYTRITTTNEGFAFLGVLLVVFVLVMNLGLAYLRKMQRDAMDPLKVWDREERKRDMNERHFR